MHRAVAQGDRTIVDYMVQITEDVNALDRELYSPLGLALKLEKFKIAFRLLQEPHVDVEAGAGNYASCLFLAIAKTDVISVEKILQKGGDVNKRTASTGDTPLHALISVFQKNVINARWILEILLEHKADPNSKNND